MRTPGTLVYVMGPSGSGKDSLIAYARNRMNAPYMMTWNAPHDARLRPVLFARRYITRPMSVGGERHHCLTQEEFQSRQSQGGFALSWESHGLHYGIGNEINAHLASGAVVVVNGSREYLPEAMMKYPSLVPVLISVQPEVLRARLEKRGRENAASIDERLSRASMKMPESLGMIRLDNSRTLEEAGRVFSDVLLAA
ncbi:MAG: phosphonate metabolism protein/1,5-bisphosphokinase (PRPP-forming) PhnN [Betaproteobacteria bacterium]|nr:phosphonate metabolism protein/1,5-bisphosphokinase (PRPP-forming) PhnN [Betaproteobacteria bacterium]